MYDLHQPHCVAALQRDEGQDGGVQPGRGRGRLLRDQLRALRVDRDAVCEATDLFPSQYSKIISMKSSSRKNRLVYIYTCIYLYSIAQLRDYCIVILTL